ncbi:putative RNA helicase NPH-II [Yalta virus]|nr:putative RNA helicase NPH-II [Yalta virus]
MNEFILTQDDNVFLTTIEKNNIFLNLMLPNNINIFALQEIDNKVYEYVKKHYRYMSVLIYPVYKHLWRNSNLYFNYIKEEESDIIVCSEYNEPGLRLFNLQAVDIDELKDMIIEAATYKNGKIVISDKYTFTLEAYAFLYLQLVQIINFKTVNFFFILGLIEASIKIGCCSIPFKQKEGDIKNKYGLRPTKINLKSLIISNQMRVFDIWRNKQDVLITGGTGTGKTSQIPKLFWWFNMWLDGFEEIDFEMFDYNKIKKNTIERRTTTLSLPRKVLITSNSKFASKSLGYDNIKNSPITCKFKDVKLTEFHNPNAFEFISPFMFSINRNTTFTNVNTIIFDEIHEHDTYCDIGIAIVRKIKEEYNIRNLVLITATITNDLENLKSFFPKLVEMKIKDEYLFPIQEIDLSNKCNMGNGYKDVELIIKKYGVKANQSTLFFLPSLSAIYQMEEYLKNRLSSFYVIIKLHREAVLDNPSLVTNLSFFKDNHVVVLSTPIAESSITIDTAKVVIDSGLFFSKMFFSGEITSITDSMMKQRKGRVGRVSPGIYIRLFDLDSINTSFKKIDHEFLLPYLVSFAPYRIQYNEFLIKPSEERYIKTKIYYLHKGVDFDNNAFYINKIYNQYPCSLGEYLIIYIHGQDNEKNLLKKLDNAGYRETFDILRSNYREYLSIAKKMNLPVSIVYANPKSTKVTFKKYIEKMLSFYVNILFEKNKSYLLVKEGFALSY